MCKTHKIADKLGVKILKRLRGAEVVDVPEHGELEDGVYLVEKDGEKFVLKTGNFNSQEVNDNWSLSEIGVRTQRVTESMSGEYILYEYLEAPLLSTKEFWADSNMTRVFELHRKIAEGLQNRPMTEEQVKEAAEWIEQRPLGEWLRGSGCSTEEQAKLRGVAEQHVSWKTKAGLAWVYRDNNADHYVDMGDELAVLDADIMVKPKHYMDMRYLAWTILWMPENKLTLDWVKGWVDRLGNKKERLVTFLGSLIGILWDIYSNGTYAKSQMGRVDKIREIVELVVNELNQ